VRDLFEVAVLERLLVAFCHVELGGAELVDALGFEVVG
jgi:hypothetical protein